MRLVTIALLACATLGCGTKQTTPAQACAAAAKHGVDAMINQARGRVAAAQLPDDVRARILARQQRLESAGARMREVFTNRCVADAWAAEVVRCYTKVTTLEEMRACRTQLTVEQQARMQKDELALLTGVDAANESAADPRVQMIDRAIADARKTVADATDATDKAAAEAQLATLESERAALLAQSAGGSAASAGSTASSGSGSAASGSAAFTP